MMNKERIGNLADSLFAIVMTILVLKINVPELPAPSDSQIWQAVLALGPVLVAYVARFLALSTYWIAHHYMMSVIAENVNRTLTMLNIPFFMFIALVPFSTHLLGLYPKSSAAISIYGLNVILVGIALWFIRSYIIRSTQIKTNPDFKERDFRVGLIRTVLPIIGSALAIAASFWNPTVSILIFIFAILLNLVPSSLHLILRLFWEEERRAFKIDYARRDTDHD